MLRNLSDSDDTVLMQTLLGQLKRGHTHVFNCGNAGTVARFMLAVLAITPGQWTLDGDERLRQRPMAPLIDALRSMGCHIQCLGEEGHLPLLITGFTPQHKMAEVDPTNSSQFASAMLLIGPILPLGLTLTLTDRASSRPYINMTLHVLSQAGIHTSVSANQRVYRVDPYMPTGSDIQTSQPSRKSGRSTQIIIERDWSSASYFYAAAALFPHCRLRMQGLSLSSSCQGDKVVAEIFERLGVVTHEVHSPYRRNMHSITIEGKGDYDESFEYNFIDCPDLMPTVLVTCAALGIRARLKGVKNLRIKESDRIMALTEELGKMGCHIAHTATEVRLNPSTLVMPSQPIEVHNDHRIAMAFGILSLRYPDLQIQNPESVNKSFPLFWQQLSQLKKIATKA